MADDVSKDDSTKSENNPAPTNSQNNLELLRKFSSMNVEAAGRGRGRGRVEASVKIEVPSSTGQVGQGLILKPAQKPASQESDALLNSVDRSRIETLLKTTPQPSTNGIQVRHMASNTFHSKQSQKSEVEESETSIDSAEKSLLQKIVRKGLIDNKHELEIKRKDPNSPLYSVKSFENLRIKPELLRGLYEMGYNFPSKIQETAVPTLLACPPQNMIAQSQSGTGKTAAFAIAMLSRVNPDLPYPQGLCVAPTFELAIQIGEVVSRMGRYCPQIKIIYAVKGEEINRGDKIDHHIVIGTPGKICDWALKLRVFDLHKLTVFVLDEADVMIDRQGHQEFSYRMRKDLSSTCQIMLFSATYDAAVMKFAERMVPNPIIIRLRREEESLENIKQYYVQCVGLDAKYRAIENIYAVATISQAIIFCHTKRTASWLCEKMTKDGHAVALLTGELPIEQRINVLDRFRQNMEKVLITTNVLARGIDIETVALVVNFDLPVDRNGEPDCETYLHRIGRTGRFGKMGIAINLVDDERSLNNLKAIQQHFRVTIHSLNTDDWSEMEKLEQK